MTVPMQWRDYLCEDYFSSPLTIEGYWDESSELWLIEPAERLEQRPNESFLQVGRPGVDDIGFGYRKGQPGFWALHRLTGHEFQYLAPSIRDFLDGWFAGRIVV